VQPDLARRQPPSRADVAVAVAAALVAVVVDLMLNSGVRPRWAAAVTELPAVIMLIWRRRYPLTTVAVAAASTGLEASLGVPVDQPVAPLICLVVSLYTVAVEMPVRRALLGPLVVVPGLAIATWHISGASTVKLGNLLFVMVIGGGAWTAGRLVRVRTHAAVDQARRADRLAAENAVAIAEERGRIARELHDVVGHCVSVMVVQAGAAQAVLSHDAQRALEPLEAVQATGRQALAEMSRLVGLLRDDEHRLAPQPGLADLDALVEQMRDAGLPVILCVEGQPRTLSPIVDLSAYRIVQEALTNALKHAGGARAEVCLRYGTSDLEVAVRDDGEGESGGHRGGHGLVGMRERVHVVGGDLHAGPRPDGGFAVVARIPIGVG